jgi:hypothetical protein
VNGALGVEDGRWWEIKDSANDNTPCILSAKYELIYYPTKPTSAAYFRSRLQYPINKNEWQKITPEQVDL